MTTPQSIQSIFKDAKVGDEVRIQGWVRTRRDSKAGISFIQVHDGSCFAPIQVVASSDLENYEQEINVSQLDRPLISSACLLSPKVKGRALRSKLPKLSRSD